MDTKQPLSIEAFFTRETANQGRDFPLPLPDGSDSGETIHLVCIDSDIFRAASTIRSKEHFRIIALPEEEQDAAKEAADTELLASCVTGWSLATECTREHVVKLLTEARHVREMVDNTVTKRNAFFAKR